MESGAAAKHIALYSDSLPLPIRSKALPSIGLSASYITVTTISREVEFQFQLDHEKTLHWAILQDKQHFTSECSVRQHANTQLDFELHNQVQAK